MSTNMDMYHMRNKVRKATKWAQFPSGLHIIIVFFSGYDGVVPHVCENNIEISQSKKEKTKNILIISFERHWDMVKQLFQI